MLKKVIGLTFLLGVFAIGFILYPMYQKVYQPNVVVDKNQEKYFYIHTEFTFDDVVQQLYEQGYILDRASFEWTAEKKSNFKNNIHPGRYLLKNKMNNNELVDLLRSGVQTHVKVTFNNIRTKTQLAGKVTKNLECDSIAVFDLLSNREFTKKYGFNTTTILTLFLPNTYKFNWNTSAEELIARMADEYKKIWTEERIAKAKKLNLSQSEVSILASIVQAEQTMHNDERPKVAGLYINRLRKKMRLQSDPTVIYGWGDFTITRVLTKHLKRDTPYNTYIHSGLPPGPINLPSIQSLDAVLNYESHDYIYMCAKEDFSGYHNFAKTLNQHNIYARKFRQELNRRRIYN